MSGLTFSKMHGAGNDFIVIDCSENQTETFSPEQVQMLCSRQKGIGADGLILLTPLGESQDGCNGRIRMKFFNCDGSSAELCGNGLRCAVCFSFRHHLSRHPRMIFETESGPLSGFFLENNLSRIELQVNDTFKPYSIYPDENYPVYKGSVGVPHAVVLVRDPGSVNIQESGMWLRHHPDFGPQGANVDFVQLRSDYSKPATIRTFERGVEAETLACGTGAGAAAHVLYELFGISHPIQLATKSGDILTVERKDSEQQGSYLLTGPAVEVFSGKLEDLQEELSALSGKCPGSPMSIIK